ncbi:MAG: hypothetical protein WCA20_00050 [Candidatus Sulfotelmatobacter sp.]
MDIDKRLEALTMNVELLTGDVHELQGIIRQLSANVEKVSADIRELGGYIKDIATGTARLSFDNRTHKDRLDDHERRLESLEG